MRGVTTITANDRLAEPTVDIDRGAADDAAAKSTVPRPPAAGGVPWTVGSLVTFLVLASAGCSPFQLAHRTLHGELNEFPRLTDGKASCREYKQWAQEEWAQIASESPEAFSDDYESGFLQGFVDHVYAGGRTVPPVMPPRRYWRLPHRNARGQLAIRQWYAGFEHGARAAHEGGYRERAIIPSSLLPGQTDAAGEWNAHDQWIELDPSESADEVIPAPEPTRATPTPPVPPESATPDASTPDATETPAEPATGSAHLTPGGLPIPNDALALTTGSTVSRPAAEPAAPTPVENASAHPIASATQAKLDTQAAVRTARTATEQIAQPGGRAATELPLEPTPDGPPAPPWTADTASTLTSDRSANVRLASAQAAANTEATTESHVRRSSSPARPSLPLTNFDPFAGTRFAELSQAARGQGEGLAVEPTPANADSAVVSDTPQADAAGSWVVAGQDRSASRTSMPHVKPLEAITGAPGRSMVTTTLSDPSSASGNSLPATIDETTETENASSVDEPAAGEAATGESQASAAEPAAAPGWQAVETESATQWKGTQ